MPKVAVCVVPVDTEASAARQGKLWEEQQQYREKYVSNKEKQHGPEALDEEEEDHGRKTEEDLDKIMERDQLLVLANKHIVHADVENKIRNSESKAEHG